MKEKRGECEREGGGKGGLVGMSKNKKREIGKEKKKEKKTSKREGH